jgi:hypothetical protein
MSAPTAGYHYLELTLDVLAHARAGLPPRVLVCDQCGASIGDTATHTAWHASLVPVSAGDDPKDQQ